jgi:very-short-patch-repair endonuclease
VHSSQRAEQAAKRLRKAATLAEQRLWTVLRRLDLGGGHFRRQAPFGPYVVDFVHHGARLIVEVDGGVHRLPEVARNDAEREAWLTQRRYVVIRVANAEALYEADTIAQKIAATVNAGAPNPTFPRTGKGLP